jgi:hypothetical protein
VAISIEEFTMASSHDHETNEPKTSWPRSAAETAAPSGFRLRLQLRRDQPPVGRRRDGPPMTSSRRSAKPGYSKSEFSEGEASREFKIENSKLRTDPGAGGAEFKIQNSKFKTENQ